MNHNSTASMARCSRTMAWWPTQRAYEILIGKEPSRTRLATPRPPRCRESDPTRSRSKTPISCIGRRSGPRYASNRSPIEHRPRDSQVACETHLLEASGPESCLSSIDAHPHLSVETVWFLHDRAIEPLGCAFLGCFRPLSGGYPANCSGLTVRLISDSRMNDTREPSPTPVRFLVGVLIGLTIVVLVFGLI